MVQFNNNILIVRDITLQQLAISGENVKRQKLIKLLDEEGKGGWQPYQVTDSAEGLLVFLKQEN